MPDVSAIEASRDSLGEWLHMRNFRYFEGAYIYIYIYIYIFLWVAPLGYDLTPFLGTGSCTSSDDYAIGVQENIERLLYIRVWVFWIVQRQLAHVLMSSKNSHRSTGLASHHSCLPYLTAKLE